MLRSKPAAFAPIGVALALNAALGVVLAGGRHLVVMAVALLPVVVLAVTALALGDRSILALAGLALGLAGDVVNRPIGGGIFVADILVGLAIATWIAGVLAPGAKQRRNPAVPALVAVLLGVFTAAVLLGVLRGAVAYGPTPLQPLRLFLYAAIGTALVGLDVRRMVRGLTIVLYAGTAFQFVNGLQHLAAGTSQSMSDDLSTGGTRVLSVMVSLYMASAFYLAFLNLARSPRGSAQMLHTVVAALALFNIVVAFARGTFAAVVLVGFVLVVVVPWAPRRALAFAPLLLPVVALALLLSPIDAGEQEGVGETLISRLDPDLADDLSVRWRAEAGRVLWEQHEENRLFGVGFGRPLTFEVAGVVYDVDQAGHNDFLFLLAAGGLVTLVPFLGIVAVGWIVAIRRIRRVPGFSDARVLVLWGLASSATFLMNGLAEPLLVLAPSLLAFWITLLVPVFATAGLGTAPAGKRFPAHRLLARATAG